MRAMGRKLGVGLFQVKYREREADSLPAPRSLFYFATFRSSVRVTLVALREAT